MKNNDDGFVPEGSGVISMTSPCGVRVGEGELVGLDVLTTVALGDITKVGVCAGVAVSGKGDIVSEGREVNVIVNEGISVDTPTSGIGVPGG